jgi:hypothetical protein
MRGCTAPALRGPPPQLATEPVRVQRRVSAAGVIMVAWQRIALSRVHAGRTVTLDVTDTDLAIHRDDGTRTIRRTNNRSVPDQSPAIPQIELATIGAYADRATQ